MGYAETLSRPFTMTSVRCGTNMRRKKAWAIALGVAAGAAIAITMKLRPTEELHLVTGAVLAEDSDLHKQRPVAQARVTAVADGSTGSAFSDESGLFRLTMEPPISPEQSITLTVHHPDYLPFAASDLSAGKLQLLRMTPSPRGTKAATGKADVAIGNVRVRYAFRTATSQEVASAAETFDIVN